jgi:hypothetical protein
MSLHRALAIPRPPQEDTSPHGTDARRGHVPVPDAVLMATGSGSFVI